MLGRIPKNGCLTREFAKRKSQARRYAFIIEKHLLKLILFTTQSNNFHPTLSQITPPCRNNTNKNLANFLESAQNQHNFAIAKTGCASAI